MREISKKILEKYQVRKTRKQKTKFINFITENIKEAKVEEGGLFKSRNIVIGDVKNAKVVVGAHYDTCPVLPFPNFLPPKNIFLYLLYSVFLCAIMFSFCFLVSLIAGIIAGNAEFAGWTFTASAWIFLFFMLFGPANKHTANDNTSGVITVCELYASLTEKERKNVAFVLFDHEETGLWGSLFFNRKYKKEMKEKLFVNFDCVSDGDYIMVIQNKKAKEKYGEKIEEAFDSFKGKNIILDIASKVIYPSDQVNFPCNIGVAAFKKNKVFGLYMDKIHTRKDRVFDEKNIECICEKTGKMIRRMVSDGGTAAN